VVRTGVSIAEAARALGISGHTIRRRIKRGELPAERVERAQGYEWRVLIASAPPAAPGQVASNGADADHVNGQLASASGQVPNSVSGHLRTRSPGGMDARMLLDLATGLAAQLADERRLLAEERDRTVVLERERFELAGRLGYFQAELEQARATIKALEAPASAPSESASTAPAAAPRRSWWRFW
jgi:excisionase family DNA binding protein